MARRTVKALHPVHASVLRGGRPLRPAGMQRIKLEPEQREFMERLALDIFTDMSNAGASFSTALGAIYLSGLHHALELAPRLDEEASPTPAPETPIPPTIMESLKHDH